MPDNELMANYTIINVFFYFFNFSRAATQARRRYKTPNKELTAS